MKKIFYILILAAAVVMLFIWVEPFSLLLRSNDIKTDDYAESFNLYRESEGLKPLVFTDDLNQIALKRLDEIQANFSHASKGGYNTHIAENIVKGVYNNEEALEVWKESFLHRANMLNKNYKNTGYAAGDGYAVQVFSEYETQNGDPILPPGWHF